AAQDAKAALIDRYKLAIISKIRGNTEVPEGVPSGTTLEVDLTVLPTGEVMMPVKIVKSSGNAFYDQAVVRGIMRSQPLPLPTEPELRREFRVTHLQLKHEK
ncbi:MAG: TonB C-terminal domain-containing protein, partial [Ferrovum sp.]|nr:TonB C-terminal domain-containing protein [Ferrovum sp.]